MDTTHHTAPLASQITRRSLLTAIFEVEGNRQRGLMDLRPPLSLMMHHETWADLLYDDEEQTRYAIALDKFRDIPVIRDSRTPIGQVDMHWHSESKD